MALWTGVVDAFKGKKSLDKVPMEDLERQKITLDQQERKQIAHSQQLVRSQERFYAQGRREPSDSMKSYYARKVVETERDVRLNDDVLRALSHKQRIVNGIIAVKKRTLALSGDKKSIENRISVPELTQWVEKNTVNTELKEQQVVALVEALERGVSVISEMGTAEDPDVDRVKGLMNEPVADDRPLEDIARDDISRWKTEMRAREA